MLTVVQVNIVVVEAKVKLHRMAERWRLLVAIVRASSAFSELHFACGRLLRAASKKSV